MPLARAAYPLGDAWEPGDLGSDLISYYDTWDAARYTLNGSDYSALTDGNAVANLTQGTASKQPAQITSAWNGNAIARFTRSSAEILRTGAVSALDSPASLGIFGVINLQAYPATQYLGGVYGSTVRLEWVANSSTNIILQIVAGGTTTNYNMTYAVGTRFAFFYQIKANGNRNFWKNGTELSDVSGNVTTASTHSNTAMGGRFNDTFHASCEYSHLGITRELSDANIGLYNTWATTKFSL